MTAEVRIRVSAKDEASSTLQKMQKELAAMKGTMDRMGQAGMAFGTVGAIGALKSLTQASLSAYLQVEKLDRAYVSITGSGAGAARMLGEIRKETERLGLAYVDSADQARGFFASIRGTTIQGAQGMNIFTGMSEAGVSLGLTTVDMDRAFRALGQIAGKGKGKVMAEELRGQLGEVVPGAFQIAARAMGMTTMELDKFMADGKLLAEDFLPFFGEQMRKEFGESAVKASDSAQASINRMSSAWTEFKANLMDSQSMIAVIEAVTGALEWRNVRSMANKETQTLDEIARKMGTSVYMSEISPNAFVGRGALSTRTVEDPLMKDYIRLLVKGQQDVRDIVDSETAKTEKAQGENRKRINEAWKKTAAGQREALEQEHKETMASFDAMVGDYAKQGLSTDKLLTQRAASIKDYQRKLESLDKKEGGKSTEGALIALQGINAELAKLEGRKAESFGESLTKKLMEIARKGKEAKLSLAEITALQERYSAAAQTDLEKRQSIALRKISAETASAMGDDTQARALEREESLRKWKEELLGLGLALDLVQPRLAEWNKAQELKSTIKDAEAAARFYKELGQLSGSYGLSIEKQNELLRLQAENLIINVGISRELANEWLRLQRLETARDPFSGMERGLRKLSSESTNFAQLFEGTVTNAFRSGEDAMVSMTTKGKLEFSSMADAIIGDLTRMAYRMMMFGSSSGGGGNLGGILGGLTSIIGGLFGGGGGATTQPGMAPTGSAMGLIRSNHTGGIIGVDGAQRMADLRLFAGAKRFHAGGYPGLGPDEVPIIGLRGERVLNRAETRAYDAGLAAARLPMPRLPQMPAASSPAPAPIIQIITPPGMSAEQSQEDDGQGNMKTIIKIIDNRIDTRGAANMAQRGTPANRTLRNQFGLNTRLQTT